VPTSLKILQLA